MEYEKDINGIKVKITQKMMIPFKSSFYDYPKDDIDSMNDDEVVNRIIKVMSDMQKFWSKSKGWAHIEASDLLEKSRLDWLASLAEALKIWQSRGNIKELEYGELILAWANMGGLVEGILKLFLSIHYKEYLNDPDKITDNHGNIIGPEEAQFERMRQFFNKKFWKKDMPEWDGWVLHIQNRRNAIHAYRNREIGDTKEFLLDLKKLLKFLRIINYTGLPYPDKNYIPRETDSEEHIWIDMEK